MNFSQHAGRRASRMHANPWLIFAVIGVGSFLGPLSGSIVNVALPTIGDYYHTDLQSVKWVVLVFLVVNTFLLPLAGKWGQRFGGSRLYVLGFILYGLGSMLCGISAHFALQELVLARVIQAMGSALLFATSGALVAKFIPPERRGLAFGLVGSIVAVALVTGPVLGGVICASWNWTWIFWVQLPVALLGVISSLVLLPTDEHGEALEFPVASSVAWVLLIGGLSLVGEAFSKGLWVEYLWLSIPLTALAFSGLIASERRGPPLFDYSMFRLPAFRMAAAGALMLNLIFFTLLLFLPFYLQVYLNLSQGQTGMILGISPLATFAFGPAMGHLADRFGFRLPILTGMALMTLGFLALSEGITTHALWPVAASMALLGAGSGMFGGPNLAAMMGSVSPAQRPLAGSMGALTRNLGFMIGTSAGSIGLGLLLAHVGGHSLMLAARTEELTPQSVPAAAFVYAFSHLALICAVLAFLGLLGNLRFPNRLPAAIALHEEPEGAAATA